MQNEMGQLEYTLPYTNLYSAPSILTRTVSADKCSFSFEQFATLLSSTVSPLNSTVSLLNNALSLSNSTQCVLNRFSLPAAKNNIMVSH